MDEFATYALTALLFLPLALPILIVAIYRSKYPICVSFVVFALMFISTGAYSIWGMNYEDFDLPFPIWWILGLGAAQVGYVLAALAAIHHGWRWLAGRRAKRSRR